MEPELLADLASAVADGAAVDWDAAESSARTPAERNVIAQLRILASVQSVARTPAPAVDETSDTESSIAPISGSMILSSEAPTQTRAAWTWRHLKVLERVGHGGFGAVFRAWDSQLDKDVALKLIPTGTIAAALNVAAGGEGRLLARVRHPNVVTIHGADHADGHFGLWMEFVRGRTLRQIVEDRGPFGAQEALTLGAEIARALAAVHACALVHRDLKAQNVMREDGGRLVLMDFGAGEDLMSSGPPPTTGTPVYMAPELFEHRRATPQTDIYSLGVLLFYLVTGKYPVAGHTWADARAAHQSGERRWLRDLRPDLPAAFVDCVEALTAPDPSKRIQTAGAAESAIQRALVGAERRHRWGIMAAAAALVVVAALSLGANLETLRSRFWGASPVRTIAVLPMANLSGDNAREYFVDGMTDQLIAELSRISALRVTDRTSVMGYKQTTKRLNEIANELGVDMVLEGSIVLAGSDLRLTAALIRAADGSRMWSKSYERPTKDAFGLQAELARDLAASIQLVLTSEERRDLERTFQASQEAQDLYLRGRALLFRLDRTRQREACDLLERAVALEPKYALAWASLSRCYGMMEVIAGWTPATASLRVKEAASRAISEDSSLSEAHAALADARFRYDWDWRGARDSYEQSLAVNPSFSLARDRYARFLAAAGRTDEAVDQARQAVESDPLTAETRVTLGLMLFYQRRYIEALARTDEATALNASSPGTPIVRGRILAALGRHDEAIASIRLAMSMSNDSAQLAELGRIYAMAGRRDEAMAVLQRLPGEQAADGFVHSQDAGYILAALGRPEEALARLEKAVEDRSSRILFLRVDPRVEGLRDRQRFRALLVRIGGLD